MAQAIRSTTPGTSIFSILTGRAMLLPLGLIALCTVYLFYYQYRQAEERVLESVQAEFLERLSTLDRSVANASSGIDLLSAWSRHQINHPESIVPNQRVLAQLGYTPTGDYFERDMASQQDAFNIIGVGMPTGRNADFARDLALAVQMGPLLKVIKQESAVIVQNYFFSNQQVSCVYPHFSVKTLLDNVPATTLSEALERFYEPHAQRQIKSKGRPYWTDVYLDRAGQGLVVTHAAPLFEANRFIGVVAADITLDFLKQFTSAFKGPAGRLLLVNESGKILTDSEDRQQQQTDMVAKLSDRLPPALVRRIEKIDGAASDGRDKFDNLYIFSAALQAAPWRLVYLIKQGSLSAYLTINRATLISAAALLAIFFVLTYLAISRKKAEMALARSRERYVDLVENAIVGICSMTDAGKFIMVNPRFAQMLGYQSPEAFHKAVESINQIYAHPDEHAALLTQIETSGHLHDVETQVKRKDGDCIWVSVNGHVIESTTEPAVIEGFFLDITDRKRADQEKQLLESKLVQSQKMEAIGTLAGGIAHDFNNILSAILGYTELSLADLKEGTEIHSNLRKIFQAGGRARDLVKQILTFSRQSDQEIMPVSLEPIVAESMKLIRASLPATIRIAQHLDSGAVVMADPTQINQIMMNLCTNAGHAMEATGGVLTVRLEEKNIDATAPGPVQLPTGHYLVLSIADTGTGMTDEVRENMFNPFFTTKARGKGTGMGLAVVHGIVETHRAHIQVDSTPDQGTTFKIYFPILRGRFSATDDPQMAMPTGSERILFVDDEMFQVDLGTNILTRLGYRVEARTSSREALELFSQNPSQFDLVISDLTMPQMTGDVLTRKILKLRPDMPVILCTGYSERITHSEAKALGARRFVMKPLVIRDLANIVRKVLDEPTS